jgi:hypothetical protein
MQNYCKTIGALAAASALVAGNAKAEIEYDIHTGYTSAYLFRGLDLGDNLTELGLDAATEMNGIKLSAGLWYAGFNNTNLGPANRDEIANEVDFYAQVSKDLGFATLSVGYIYYWNVGNLGADFQEVPFTISRDFGFMNAYLSYFYDIVGDNDGYTELGGSKSWTLSPCLTLNWNSNVGYLVEQGQLTAWTNKLSLDWGFREHAKISPFVSFALSMSDDNDTAYFHSENELVAGTMLHVSF